MTRNLSPYLYRKSCTPAKHRLFMIPKNMCCAALDFYFSDAWVLSLLS